MTHPLQGTLENRDGTWILTMQRDIAHPSERVWPWLTEPDRLRRWSPVVPDRALDSVGPRQVRENPDHAPGIGDVLAADPPHELVHRWGTDVLRWRLSPTATGCLLTLEHSMTNHEAAAGNAAGWHLCLDVLERILDGTAADRVVGRDALDHGWESLRDGYAELLGVASQPSG